MPGKPPSIVIVGRPNVGKSTLFNRLTGTRRSIVTNEPGITRDRIYGKAEWRGRTLEIVDTGGIIPDDKALIPQEIFRQARVAFEKAALPVVVAVNKVDAPGQESQAAEFHSLGARIFPIAAEHGTGVDDLLDYALELTGQPSVPSQGAHPAVPDLAIHSEEEAAAPIEIAIIGRPNVGKST